MELKLKSKIYVSQNVSTVAMGAGLGTGQALRADMLSLVGAAHLIQLKTMRVALIRPFSMTFRPIIRFLTSPWLGLLGVSAGIAVLLKGARSTGSRRAIASWF